MKNKNWQNIWVIGASSGIGAAIVQKFIAETDESHESNEAGQTTPRHITISARSHETLQKMALASPCISAVPCDVTAPASVDQAIDLIESEHGLPDLVIYCAGFYNPMPVDEFSRDIIAHHIAVNYQGAVNCLEPLLRKMRARGHGEIAITASVVGYRGLPKAGAYGPTKAALISLCETLREELTGSGVVMRVINPGFVKTPMTDQNDFNMPYLQTPEQAADFIYYGLRKNDDFEIAFPPVFVRQLKLARILPYRWYFKLIERMIQK
ncbi:SDR family NAD(P)-dependent oxidoreductase [Thalassospira mesophila]|uniref:Short-chain dehydrogenase n=1 Tax=Thalassospira mesophila TaxID=1293891 RepID=A0A1Y2L1J3_9PROT|nr:SDR family NAD(P)-dependent oxidoreductase [Thalassospira mesophila]OSQ39348.1 short-chain dehydrogenase [Thalassospira mesophila]